MRLPNFGDWVTVKKVAPAKDPHYPTGAKGEWVEGAYNPGITTYIGYEVTGLLGRDILEGVPMWVDRRTRNGVSAMGSMTTSKVLRIEPISQGVTRVYTQNSVYEVTVLPGEPKDG